MMLLLSFFVGGSPPDIFYVRVVQGARGKAVFLDKYYDVCYHKAARKEHHYGQPIGATGDHYHFKRPTKPGKVTVPHPSKDLFRKTLDSIEKQSGLRFK